MYIYFASKRPEVSFALYNVDVYDPLPPVLVVRLLFTALLNWFWLGGWMEWQTDLNFSHLASPRKTIVFQNLAVILSCECEYQAKVSQTPHMLTGVGRCLLLQGNSSNNQSLCRRCGRLWLVPVPFLLHSWPRPNPGTICSAWLVDWGSSISI